MAKSVATITIFDYVAVQAGQSRSNFQEAAVSASSDEYRHDGKHTERDDVDCSRNDPADQTHSGSDLKRIAARSSGSRTASLQLMADAIRRSSNYRWVGLYDVDHVAGTIENIVWSGPGAPAHSEFPITKGLSGVTVAEKCTVIVGDVGADPRYLTAFDTTNSEIIVPIFDRARQKVIGTIDVESQRRHAFGSETQKLLGQCADVIAMLWSS
jgi:L-methionine (R)-S-oxide reductase